MGSHNQRTVVVTGVEGFVGRHVVYELTRRGHIVHGVTHHALNDEAFEKSLASLQKADLRSNWPRNLEADAIIHLAGLASVGDSFTHPQKYIDSNSAMITEMAESLLTDNLNVRVVVASTGALYAQPTNGEPIAEQSSLHLSSPYTVSKRLVELQLAYYRIRGLETIAVRPFNHIGPGQRHGFLVPDLYEALRVHSPGSRLAVGNLRTRRDYTDVRDVARAYADIATASSLRHTTYNVCSGTSYSGLEILEILCREMGIEHPELQVDPRRMRPSDVESIVGSAHRIRGELGWTPLRTVEYAIRDFVKSLT